MRTDELFDMKHTLASGYLSSYRYPWEALARLNDFVISLGDTLPPSDFEEVSPRVWVHKSATVFSTAYLGAPCIIGKDTEVRHCAFVRGGVLIGDGCVVGNSTELKNAVLFDGVQVPHYNYVGDSILGYRAHLGAGAITSNVKSDRSPVVVHGAERDYPTNLKKCGAMIGDYSEIGCNSVLNPGIVVGRNSTVYPLSCVRVAIPANCIYKTGGTIVKK